MAGTRPQEGALAANNPEDRRFGVSQIVHFGAFVGVVGSGSPVVWPVAVPAVSALLGGLKVCPVRGSTRHS